MRYGFSDMDRMKFFEETQKNVRSLDDPDSSDNFTRVCYLFFYGKDLIKASRSGFSDVLFHPLCKPDVCTYNYRGFVERGADLPEGEFELHSHGKIVYAALLAMIEKMRMMKKVPG